MQHVFVHFLEEFEDPKKAFRNYLTFSNLQVYINHSYKNFKKRFPSEKKRVKGKMNFEKTHNCAVHQVKKYWLSIFL